MVLVRRTQRYSADRTVYSTIRRLSTRTVGRTQYTGTAVRTQVLVLYRYIPRISVYTVQVQYKYWVPVLINTYWCVRTFTVIY